MKEAYVQRAMGVCVGGEGHSYDTTSVERSSIDAHPPVLTEGPIFDRCTGSTTKVARVAMPLHATRQLRSKKITSLHKFSCAPNLQNETLREASPWTLSISSGGGNPNRIMESYPVYLSR